MNEDKTLTYQQVEALAEKHLIDMTRFDYVDSNSLVDLVNDAIRLSEQPKSLKSYRVAQLRKALIEARDAMRVMADWVKNSDPSSHTWGTQMVERASAVLKGNVEQLECPQCGARGPQDDWLCPRITNPSAPCARVGE